MLSHTQLPLQPARSLHSVSLPNTSSSHSSLWFSAARRTLFFILIVITGKGLFLSLLHKPTFDEQKKQKYFQSNATLVREWSFLVGTDIVYWHLVFVNLRLQSLCRYSISSECLKFLR